MEMTVHQNIYYHGNSEISAPISTYPHWGVVMKNMPAKGGGIGKSWAQLEGIF
jgi:hypothetical protein